MTEDTSAYWRKLLALDQPLPLDPLKPYRSWLFSFNHLIFFLIGLISRFWAPIEATGVNNVPTKSPYILCPNHLSIIDYGAVVLPLPAQIRPDLYPLTTKHFYDNPVTGTIIKMASRAVRIDTMEDFFPALRAAAQILRAGKSVYLNPEGTRSPTGELLPFKVGVGILAVELGVPVVPIFIKGTFEILKPGEARINPGPVKVAYGKPIGPGDFIKLKDKMQAYDVYQAFTEELRKRIEELSK